MEERERGLSTTSLALLFLLGVAVCAVFFALGFLVGYKERSFSHMPEIERVTPTGDTPPVVNPPPEQEEISTRHDATAAPASRTVQPVGTEANQKSESLASGAKASAEDAGPREPKSASQRTAALAGNRDSASAPGSDPTGRPVTGGTVLQVAALQTRQDAQALVKALKEHGYPVFLVTPEEAGANDKLFRVRVGPFTSRDEEENIRKKLLEEGFKPFVKR